MTTEIQRIVFSESMKLADLIDVNFKLLNVLSRLNISLGFGENTIKEVCERQGINLNSFLLICNIYTYDSYIPSAELLSGADPETIVEYLHNSHAFYLDKEFAGLERNLKDMVEPCDAMQKKIVAKFFADYKTQVENHFSYEESVVFPYVRALIEGGRQESYSIEQFEENHSNIDETLNDLKNIVMKYLPETCDTVLRNEVLYRIYRLEEDLLKHTVIEDSVLIPMVNKLEER
ncbi:MAG: hemerythrin domain-containing protein [Bacteroidales bacterium]|nr:hemerythrin domain-containing protein [Bacteroidales bacterium]